MKTTLAIDTLKRQAETYQKVAEYLVENYDDDEDVDIDEVIRDFEEQDAQMFADLEERSMENSWQQEKLFLTQKQYDLDPEGWKKLLEQRGLSEDSIEIIPAVFDMK